MLTKNDLFRHPDAHGECDGCHHDHCQLWQDDDAPGEFQYCADCIRHAEDRRKVNNAARRARDAAYRDCGMVRVRIGGKTFWE